MATSFAIVNIFLSVFLLNTVQSKDEKKWKIAPGGQKVPRGRLSEAVVAILRGQNDDLIQFPGIVFCTGTVISSRTILTNAHCFDFMKIHYFDKNYLNKHISIRTSAGVTYYGGKEVIVHHNYNGPETSLNPADIALFILEKPIKSVESIMLIPKDEPRPTKEYDAKIVGYGQTSFNDKLHYGKYHLFGGDVKVLMNDKCSQLYGLSMPIEIICAAGHPHKMCKGDSGGPMFKKITIKSSDRVLASLYAQFGILTYGINSEPGNASARPSCKTSVPDFGISVIEYTDWIWENDHASKIVDNIKLLFFHCILLAVLIRNIA